mgnify:FL=1
MHTFSEKNVVFPMQGKDIQNLSNSTAKIFQKKYNKKLFLESEDMPIHLSDVYIEPKLIDKNLKKRKQRKKDKIEGKEIGDSNAIEYIEKFVEGPEDKVLFIEGVAGAGKSSLLSKMATVLYGKDIFYKSLKDYLNLDLVRLKIEINKTFSLNDNDFGKIIFLDGLDEIWNKIDLNEFEDDLKFFLERGYKVVFTVRPEYVPY